MAVDRTACRDRLQDIGERRKRILDAEKKLRSDTRKAIEAAKGVIPVAEAARLAGLNRSTVYELYLRGDENGSTHGKSRARKRGTQAPQGAQKAIG